MSKNLLVLGDPGAGKTSFINLIYYLLSNTKSRRNFTEGVKYINKPKVPLFVNNYQYITINENSLSLKPNHVFIVINAEKLFSYSTKSLFCITYNKKLTINNPTSSPSCCSRSKTIFNYYKLNKIDCHIVITHIDKFEDFMPDI